MCTNLDMASLELIYNFYSILPLFLSKEAHILLHKACGCLYLLCQKQLGTREESSQSVISHLILWWVIVQKHSVFNNLEAWTQIHLMAWGDTWFDGTGS